jgi:hypothetical protein
VIWTRTEFKCGAKAGVAREQQVVLAPHSDASKCVLPALASYYRAAREQEDHEQHESRKLWAKFAILDEAGLVVPQDNSCGRALLASRAGKPCWQAVLASRAGKPCWHAVLADL